MNDFLELLHTPGDQTVAALGRLNDPAAVLDGEDDGVAGEWKPWAG